MFHTSSEDDINKAHELVEYYLGSVDNINEDNWQGMVDMFTDAGWLYGTHKMVNYLANHGVTVFQYILTYQGKHSLTQLYGLDTIGVCHGDDLFYIWELSPFLVTDEDLLVSNTMTDAWVNFAMYGDPTPSNSKLSWTPVDPEMSNSLNFWNISGPEPVMQRNSKLDERMNLWNKVMGHN